MPLILLIWESGEDGIQTICSDRVFVVSLVVIRVSQGSRFVANKHPSRAAQSPHDCPCASHLNEQSRVCVDMWIGVLVVVLQYFWPAVRPITVDTSTKALVWCFGMPRS
jgi:hypothetical protein